VRFNFVEKFQTAHICFFFLPLNFQSRLVFDQTGGAEMYENLSCVWFEFYVVSQDSTCVFLLCSKSLR